MCIGCAQSGLAVAESVGIDNQTSKLLAIATSAVMLFATAAPMINPASTIKGGAICTKANQKVSKAGNTFICKKNGKKLTWQIQAKKPKTAAPSSQRAPVSPVVTAPKVSNFFETNPWSTTPTREQLIESALLEVEKFVNRTGSKSAQFEIFYDDNILASDKEWMNRQIAFNARAFADFHPDKYVAFVALNDKWIMDRLVPMGFKTWHPTVPCGGPTTWENYCAGKNWGAFVLKGRYEQNPGATKIDWPASVIGVFGHEYFHSVQNHFHNGTFNRDPAVIRDSIPAWLLEGSASFIGGTMGELEGAIKYNTLRTSEVDNHPDYKTSVARNSLRAFWNNWRGEPGGYKNPYGIGQVATEYIVANVGVERMVYIFKYTTELKDFAAGFEKAVGISLNDFYTKFDQIRSRVGLPAVN